MGKGGVESEVIIEYGATFFFFFFRLCPPADSKFKKWVSFCCSLPSRIFTHEQPFSD